MTTISINTTYGKIEFTFHANNMTALNTDTGENIYSGEPDERLLRFVTREITMQSYADASAQIFMDELNA